jgi:hypothetical protein
MVVEAHIFNQVRSEKGILLGTIVEALLGLEIITDEDNKELDQNLCTAPLQRRRHLVGEFLWSGVGAVLSNTPSEQLGRGWGIH